MDDVPPAQSDKPLPSPIREMDLVGFKYFNAILPLLDRLHDHACARDKAHNRDLHYDQYGTLLLLFFFNPIVTPMRGLVQASTLDKVRKKLGVLPTSLGSFSEAGGVFDPDPLHGIAQELGAKLTPLKHDARQDQVPGILTLVDGTVISALAKLVGHLGHGKDGADILSDQIAWLGCDSKRDELKQKLRIIKIKCTPHRKRIHNGRDGPEQGEFLLIATDMLDLPAEVIGLIYQARWTVEIFFRFFKHILGCRHLLSHRENGIKIPVYMAIIACMLITLWSGRKPTLRTVEMMQFYFTGWATEEELDAHIAKLKKQDE